MRSADRSKMLPGAVRGRRFGRVEGAIFAAAALGAAGLLAFAGASVSTLEHSVSLAQVTQEIHVDVLQSQRALFQVSDGDGYVDVGEDVIGNVVNASVDCRSLLTGREDGPLRIRALRAGPERDSAGQLCERSTT